MRRDTYVLADVASDADPDRVQSRIEALLKRRYPSAEALNQSQLKEDQEAQLQPVLAMVYGLLFLAVLVSIFGIVNTLALSIHERTRELGMLRAIGMSRRQVKQMIRYESVITALIGAILGTVLGVIFAAVVSRPLADEGFGLSYPIVNLLVILVLAAAGGRAGGHPARPPGRPARGARGRGLRIGQRQYTYCQPRPYLPQKRAALSSDRIDPSGAPGLVFATRHQYLPSW